MLLQRSILPKVCLLLAVCLVKAQYEYDDEEKKEVKEEEEDDRNYAKIFAEETAAALTAATEDAPDESPKQGDYVTPVEFETYFTPAHIFGESNEKEVKASPQKKKKEPLQPYESRKEDYSSYFDDGPLKDFFEDSEKKQQKLQKEQSSKDEEVIPPGPSYISHQIPARYSSYGDDDDDKSTSASEDHPSKRNKQKGGPGADEEGRVEKEEEDYKLPVPFTFDPYKTSKTSNKPKVDYDTGKSSSTVSQYPAASGYEKAAESNPYEKYSYQPAEDYAPKKSKSSPAASGYEKPAESSPYEKYSYQPAEDYAPKKSKPSPESSGYEKPAESSPYEKYSFQPVEDYEPRNDKSSSASSGYEKPAESNPYEKYSFQPSEDYAAQNSKFFDSIISTVQPYNPNYKKNTEPKYETQSSENSPSQLQGKGCRKVSSSSQADDMNCFICENPKTNAKYTQCSYSSQKKPVDYYEGNSAKYSNKQEPSAYRYKRYADNDENDPYTYIRNRARKASEHSGLPSDFGAGFHYEAEHYDESKPELTFSEQHSEEIKKNPENCQKIDKDGMTCTVCKDPKSGGNFEQCSYTSKPKEKKFAYVTEKKFDNDEPSESQVVSQAKAAESSEKQKSNGASKENTELIEEYQGRVKQEKSPKKRNEEGRDYEAKPSEKKDESSFEFPSHFHSPSYKDSPYKASGSENVDKKKKSDFSDFDEYHFKYFPEFAKQESKHEPVQESYEIPAPEATKQNVESVLEEFTKKDRSNCKKAQKKGMTCFLCVDKNNIQHEECMYIQESKPENTHVAYHEVKATEKAKPAESEKNKTEEPKQESKQEPVVAETGKKYFFKNVPSPAPLLGLEVAASEQVGTFVRYNPDRGSSKRKRSSKNKDSKEPKPDASAYDAERIDDKADPTIKTPEEFNVAPGEGAFSDETKAVYSKELGVQLPKYMLEKSEFEKEFDAFAGAF